MPKLNRFIFLTLSCLPLLAQASPSAKAAPKKVPLFINSNYSEMNYHTGINRYVGNVIATHGSSKLTGDTMTTYQNKAHKVDKVVTAGKPATFYSDENQGKPPVHATAATIIFYPIKHLAVFEQNAYATQGKNILKAPEITYNTQTQILESKGSKTQQVHILLTDTHKQQGNS